jgi:hypothetical protein
MDRITNVDLDLTFETLVRCAQGAGVNTEGWYFGQPFGCLYQVIRKTDTGTQRVSRDWATKREAFNGMQDMIQAFTLI